MSALMDLRVYLVTDAARCGSRGVVQTVADAVDGGATMVQLRDKYADDAAIVDQLGELAAVIDGRAALVVNDRLDAAVTARARGIRVDGVHLGQTDAQVARARELLGPDAIIGLTANRPEHFAAVAELPAGTVDYLGVGVIHPTTTKEGHPPVQGVDGFGALARTARDAAGAPVPCVAIGGIGPRDVRSLRAIGASGVAVVSTICAAPDARAAARRLRLLWDDADSSAPRVLSIAGSDPSGGAGVQADLKAIAAVGGYGMAAITALTAQNTCGVQAVHVPPAAFLRQQLDAISEDIAVDAVKIGMLADAEIIATVASWLEATQPPVVVLDPVMAATSGDRLLDADAERALAEVIAQAHLVTPNLAELAVLAGAALAQTWPDALAQAEAVAARHAVLVLAKGGHLPGAETPDALVGPEGVIAEYEGERIDTTNTHGTGCSLSSAIAAIRARGCDWSDAVGRARTWLRESIRAGASLSVGQGNGPVHHFAGLWSRGGLEPAPTPEQVERDWWTGIADVRAGIDELAFIVRLADGTLPRPSFQEYLAQDAHYLRCYARVLADAARLAPDAPAQAFWAAGSQRCLIGEMNLHRTVLGLSANDPISAGGGIVQPGRATIAYLDHLMASSARGGYEELAAAVLPCYWIYDDLGRRLLAGAFGPEPSDPDHPYAQWLSTYADPSFGMGARQAIDTVTAVAAAATPAVRARMFAAFRRSAEHELAFFAAPRIAQAAPALA